MLSKEVLRRLALQARDAQSDRDTRSHSICERLFGLPEFETAGTVLSYIGVSSEVATGEVVRRALNEGKRLAVPWVAPEGLRATFIRSLEEVALARFGLLEPPPALRSDPARACRPGEVDLFVIPGVAFDRAGGRLGHGRAYYDRLLPQARAGAHFIGLAFECQMVDAVPMDEKDIRMHAVVTEVAVYRSVR